MYFTDFKFEAVAFYFVVAQRHTQAVFAHLEGLDAQVEQYLLHRRVAESVLLELHNHHSVNASRLGSLLAHITEGKAQVDGESLGVGVIHQRDARKFGG